MTETPAVYGELLPDILPALDILFTFDAVDHLEDALEILAFFTYYLPPPFPPKLWAFFEALFQAVCGGSTPSRPLPDSLATGWARDHLELMLPVLANFIARDNESFVSGATENKLPYPECVLQMATTAVRETDEVRSNNHNRMCV